MADRKQDAWAVAQFGPRAAAYAAQAEAIRAVQRQVPAEARQYFAVAEDGSFELDAAMIEARPA